MANKSLVAMKMSYEASKHEVATEDEPAFLNQMVTGRARVRSL
jgi:hypothetical protein